MEMQLSVLPDLLRERARRTPDGSAYRQFVDDAWRDWTWGEAAREVNRWQAALAASGMKAGDRVALCLHNRTEWVFFDQAALALGLVVVPLYYDDRPENMAYCLNDAGARLLLLESGKQWPLLHHDVKTIEQVVCLDAEGAGHDSRVQPVHAWLARGDGARPALPALKPESLATIVYTSGTTGRPKGVMLSHRNILSNVQAAMKAIPAYPQDRFLSFLPLSHMFERTCGYYSSIGTGSQTVYARGISVLAEDMLSQHPTFLIAVPRIFERIWARMQEQMPPGSPKRRLFEKTVEVGWRRFQKKSTVSDRLWWPVLKALVARKIYRRLGGRIRLIIVGGAAFSPTLARIFLGLGLPIIQGYGLTETSPVISANRESDNDPLTVGHPLEGVEIKCGDGGELLVRGPNVMLGYWNNPAATAGTIDPDGWFHTGDVVTIRDGRIRITGRIKEIVVMSNGEKVPPGDIEAAILRDPAFEQVMLVGEGRPKLGLIAVSTLNDPEQLVERANAQLADFPGYAHIIGVIRAADPWTVENGMLTPTLKIKRPVVEKHFAGEIEALYTRGK
jgi:long-chain acyl-CoA synthetase